MQVGIKDTVWYIWKNKIHKGVIIKQVHIEGTNELHFRVKTYYGLQVFSYVELYETIEELVEAIKYESC